MNKVRYYQRDGMDGLLNVLSVTPQRAVMNNEREIKTFLQPVLVYYCMIEPYPMWLFSDRNCDSKPKIC